MSVDLPTLGRPAKQAKPDLNPAGGSRGWSLQAEAGFLATLRHGR